MKKVDMSKMAEDKKSWEEKMAEEKAYLAEETA